MQKDASGLLQTILIPTDKFNLMKARKWLKDNNHSYHKIDVTQNFYRFRQIDPTPGNSYYTVSLPDGIDLVYEKPMAKPNESTLIKEHKRLIKVLKEDKPKDIQLELKKQSSELKEMKKGYFKKMIEKKNAKDSKGI